MILIISHYEAIMPAVERITKANPEMNIRDLCSTIAVATQAPVLAVCYFVQRIRGESKELEDLKDRLKSFYQYEKIIHES